MTSDRANDSASRIRVVVDDRESESGTVAALQSFRQVDVEVKRLALGDYEVDGVLLFERKTMMDLTVSIMDGRLFRQATRLAASPIRPVVVLEGTAGDIADSGMRREAIQGALVSLTVVFGLPLLRSRDPQETAQLMVYSAQQVRAVARAAIPRKAFRPKGKLKAQLHVLQGLPGIGPTRAKHLLETFGSVEAAFAAAAKQLASVTGVGRQTAERIRWLVREGSAHYSTRRDDSGV